MREAVKIAFASGTDDLNLRLLERMQALYPELPLYVVSEFPPAYGQWIPYHPRRGFRENLARCRAAFRNKFIRLSGVLLVPGLPYRRLRLIALLLSPRAFLAFNEQLDSWMLRPRSLRAIVQHGLWRLRNLARWQLRPGGDLYTFLWRVARPREWRIPIALAGARIGGWLAYLRRLSPAEEETSSEPNDAPAGVSVVIPSRNGRELLEAQLPGLLCEMRSIAGEIIVVDNGSQDGTAAFLKASNVEVVVSEQPLSFASAVNRGVRHARFSHVLLLNNDMLLEPGFFASLLHAFHQFPDLFCATAQILFPPGVRRQETGKAAMCPGKPEDFPVRCLEPLDGEDLSYVLYGSGGCSLYDAAKLRALGGLREVYRPAYVEDLDIGYRAWQRNWPSVFVARSRVIHRHRATTSRYYTQAQLDSMVERNYLRFLATAVAGAGTFHRLWSAAIRRLHIRARLGDAAAQSALAEAGEIAVTAPVPASSALSEESFLALGSGAVAVFPGKEPSGRPVVMVVAPWIPYPLAHGGAVRIFNLMRRAAVEYDQVLVAFSSQMETPPAELREIACEIVVVQRTGSHSLPAGARPDEVEMHDVPAFHAALQQTVRKWRPAIAQLELTHMAQYAAECAPAKTVLVEHDVTLDLYEQLVRETGDFDAQRQLEPWRRFETAAWRSVARIVTMSEKDRALVRGAPAVVIPNGVDLERFQPCPAEPEPHRLLFLGSFAHLPNVMALSFFLTEVWPLLADLEPHLHVIAGRHHEFYLDHYRAKVQLPPLPAGVELEGFVADVRPAYRRAGVVVAPLVASAGTNIKILEAMAMGKAIVSTPAGINGLDLRRGLDLLVTRDARSMALGIRRLAGDPEARRRLERTARRTAESAWSWDRIAARQSELYRELLRAC